MAEDRKTPPKSTNGSAKRKGKAAKSRAKRDGNGSTTASSGSGDSRAVLDAAFALAKAADVEKVLLYAEAVDDLKSITRRASGRQIILVTPDPGSLDGVTDGPGPIRHVIEVPRFTLTRMGQIKIALLNALVSGVIDPKEKVVMLSGLSAPRSVDTIVLLDPSREFEVLTFDAQPELSGSVTPETFEAFLNLALEMAHTGREGRPVGTIFVLGDHEKVLDLSRQLIMNPFHGYQAESCSIHNPEIRETIREFAALDGAFVVRGDGVVLAAGRFLNAAAGDGSVPRGLGTRHGASAGITASTEAIAITLSETDGAVRVFKGGRILTEIDKPVPH